MLPRFQVRAIWGLLLPPCLSRIHPLFLSCPSPSWSPCLCLTPSDCPASTGTRELPNEPVSLLCSETLSDSHLSPGKSQGAPWPTGLLSCVPPSLLLSHAGHPTRTLVFASALTFLPWILNGCVLPPGPFAGQLSLREIFIPLPYFQLIFEIGSF